MTILAGEMSSESGGRSVLVPPECNAQGLSNELDFLLDRPWDASHDSDSESCHENLHKVLLSSENVGLLGPRSLPGVHSDIADASLPMVEEDIVPLLHKCKEPYRRPRLFNADWTDYKDEVWVSPESLGKNEGHKQSWRRDFPEIMRDGQMEAFLEKQKKTSSEERSKNVEFIKPLKLSLAAEHSDSTAIDSKRPATWSAIATKFPAIEQKSAYGISSTEGSELIAHGVSNEYLTKYPDNHLKSTTVETSQLYGCKIPAVIIGIVAFVSHEHIFKPETKEFSCSMLWDGCDAEDGRQDSANHHGSHHLMLLPEEGTEQKETTASSELPIASDELHASDSITDNNKLTFVSKGNAGECEKDLTGEPSFITSSTKGLQLTSACTCN